MRKWVFFELVRFFCGLANRLSQGHVFLFGLMSGKMLCQMRGSLFVWCVKVFVVVLSLRTRYAPCAASSCSRIESDMLTLFWLKAK